MFVKHGLDLHVDTKVYRGPVTTGLTIKAVADATGFTTATLRYYEQIGLLPEPQRTPAGYRTYDRQTLDRLAFIARAKQLGCSLAEISGLTTAWDGGRCGPIQDQLRRLVADKIAAAQHQIVELVTFSNELQQAAVALERHRPDGACDADCGCVSEPGEPAIACSLSPQSMKGRIDDWNALLAHAERRERIEGGVRAVFAPSVPANDLIRLVAAEQDCCQFFQFAITVDARGVALEVRAPLDAQPMVVSIFAGPSAAGDQATGGPVGGGSSLPSTAA
jgi:DNA-binding transcriptional MerR regulator